MPVIVQQPQAVRPDDAHPGCTCHLQDVALLEGAGRAGVGEAAAEHDDPAHAPLAAFLDSIRDCSGSQRDDGKVRDHGQVGDAAVRRHTTDCVRMRMDRIDGAGEVGAKQVSQQLAADRAGRAPDADQRDGPRPQHAFQAVHAGDPVAFVDGVEQRCFDVQRDDNLLDPAFQPPRVAHPGVLDHLEHRGVFR